MDRNPKANEEQPQPSVRSDNDENSNGANRSLQLAESKESKGSGAKADVNAENDELMAQFVRFCDRIDGRHVFLFALLIRIVAAFFSFGMQHPDEIFQTVEMAWYRITEPNYRIVPWEFGEELRSYGLSYVVEGLLRFSLWLGFEHPDHIMLPIRFAFGILDAVAAYAAYKLMLLYRGKVAAVVGSWFYCTTWVLVALSVRPLSDQVAVSLLVIAFYFFFAAHSHDNRYPGLLQACASGLFVGLAFVVRFASALFIGPMFCVSFAFFTWPTKRDMRAFALATGFLLGMTIQGLIDLATYGTFLVSPWNYLEFNVLTQGSARYGVDPFTYYVLQLILHTGIFGGILLLLSLVTDKKWDWKRILIWSSLALYLLIFGLVDHKEWRFLQPMYALLCLEFGAVFVHAVNLPRPGLRRVFLIVFGLTVPIMLLTHAVAPWDNRHNMFDAMYWVGQQEDLNGVVINDWSFGGGGHFYMQVDKPRVHFREQIPENIIAQDWGRMNYLIVDLGFDYNRTSDYVPFIELHFELLIRFNHVRPLDYLNENHNDVWVYRIMSNSSLIR